MASLKYWLWLTSRKGVDSVAALTALDYFLTPEQVYYADPEEYSQLPLRPAARQGLLDKEDKKVKEHPACYYNQDGMILDAMLEAPWLMRSPIVRNGNKVTVGYCPQVWEQWIAAEK